MSSEGIQKLSHRRDSSPLWLKFFGDSLDLASHAPGDHVPHHFEIADE